MAAGELLFDERPPGDRAARGAPLLVILHGWGRYKGHLFELARGFDPRFAIVAPQAPVRMGPGAYRWFHFERDPVSGALTIDDAEEDRSLAALRGFIDGLVAARAPTALYLLGHSQGATMALSLALDRPPGLAGGVHLNGRVLPKRLAQVRSSRALDGLAFWFGHAIEDPLIPLSVGRQTRDHVRRLGGAVSFHEYPAGHDVTPQSLSDASAWLTGALEAAPRLRPAPTL